MSAGWLLSMLDSLVSTHVSNRGTVIWRIGFYLLDKKFHHPIFFIVVETVPVRTVNRQCSSGLQAVADVAAAIKAGFYDIGNCSMLKHHASLAAVLLFVCWITVFPSNRDWCWSGIHVDKFHCLGRTSEPQSNKDYKSHCILIYWYSFYFYDTFFSADKCIPESTRLSSAHGNYFWKCCSSIWCHQARARSGCCEFLRRTLF